MKSGKLFKYQRGLINLDLEKRCIFCTKDEIDALTKESPNGMAGFDYVDRDTGEVYVKGGGTILDAREQSTETEVCTPSSRPRQAMGA